MSRTTHRQVVLDMDSSESPVHGHQEGIHRAPVCETCIAMSKHDTGDERRAGRTRLRSARVVSALLLALAGAVVMVSLVPRPRIDAQVRAAVVLVSVLEAPVATTAVEVVTGEPHIEETSVAGNPTSVFYPAGGGPYPAVVFVNGTLREGRKYEEVRDLARGLARAGYLTVVPDLPGLRTDTISPKTVSETVEVAREVSGRPDARAGKVGLMGVSTGGTLAILAAERPALEGRVSAVVGVAPYADIETVLALATTNHYELNGEMVPYEADPFLSYVVGRSLVSTLPPGEDRAALLAELDAVKRYGEDPLRVFRDYPTECLGPEARSVVALLANRDPGHFEALYRGLPPEIRVRMEKLSPVAGSERLEAPVEVASGPRDRYFPLSESYELRRVAPELRVTVTRVLDHSELSVSPRNLPEFLELNGFAVRSLRELRAG